MATATETLELDSVVPADEKPSLVRDPLPPLATSPSEGAGITEAPDSGEGALVYLGTEAPGKTLISKTQPDGIVGAESSLLLAKEAQRSKGARLHVVVEDTEEAQGVKGQGIINYKLKVEYEELQVAKWNIVKTFQEIQLFSKQILTQYPDGPAELGGRKRKETKAIVEKRREEINKYFEELFEDPNVVSLHEVSRFFNVAQNKYGTVRKQASVAGGAKKRLQLAVKAVTAVTPITATILRDEAEDKKEKFVRMKSDGKCCGSPNKEKQLGVAIAVGNEKMMKQLLKTGASIHALNDDDEGVLTIAINHGQGHLVKPLIESGADIEQRDKAKYTPLCHATSTASQVMDVDDQVALVEELLKNHASTLPLSENAVKIPRDEVKQVLVNHDEKILLPFKTENIAQAVLHLDTGLDPNWVMHDGKTLLVKVAEGFPPSYQPLPKMMDLLIRRGAKLEAMNAVGQTALHQVVMSEKFAATRMLIGYGSDVNAKTKGLGWTPLHWATDRQNWSIIEVLCNNGADVNAVDTEGGNTPLHHAANISNPEVSEANLVECARVLLRYQANFNAMNNARQTPFDIAKQKASSVAVAIKNHDRGVALLESVHRSDEKNVRALMEGDHPADINFQDPEGYTALHKALLMKNQSMVRLLLNFKPSVSVEAKGQTNNMITPIQTARGLASQPKGLVFLQMLQEYMVNAAYLSAGTEDDTMGLGVFKIDSRLPDIHGRTVLHNAAEAGSVQAVRKLCGESDVRMMIPTLVDKQGLTPLHLAARLGHFQVVEILLENGANVNKMDDDMNTPLHLALQEAFKINENADIGYLGYVPNRNLAKKYLYVVQSMLTHVADLHLWNEVHGTPVDMAQLWLAQNLSKEQLEKVKKYLSRRYLLQANCLSAQDKEDILRDADSVEEQEEDYDAERLLDWEDDGGHESGDEDEDDMAFGRMGTRVAGSVVKHISTLVTITDINNQFVEAAQSGDALKARACLRSGANINFRLRNGDTALHLATRNPPHTCVTLLLQQGARPAVVNNAGESPIDIAESQRTATHQYMWIELKKWQQGRLMQEAAGSGDVLRLKDLIDNENADPTFADFSGITPLHVAVKYQRVACIEHLLAYTRKKRANINAQNRAGKTPLHIAVEKRLDQALATLLQHKPRVDIKDRNARSVLDIVQEVDRYGESHKFKDAIMRYDVSHKFLRAAEMGDMDALVDLKNTSGFKIDFVDDMDETALHKAVRNKHDYVVNALLLLGADPTVINIENKTPYMLAVEGNIERIMQLTWTAQQGTRLLDECASGRLEQVKRIVENKADVYFHDAGGLQALHWAALNGRVEIINYLISVDPRKDKSEGIVHGKDSDDLRPLHYAAMSGHAQAVEALVDTDISVLDELDIHSRSALLLSTMKSNNPALLSLLKSKAKTQIHDRSGHTPLILAAQDPNPSNLRALLTDSESKKLGVTAPDMINKRDRVNQTALLVATQNSNLESMKLLLEAGANTDMEDLNGETPLIIAARKGLMQQVVLLLDRGVKASRGNSKGWSPLHASLQGSSPEIAELLITRGASIEQATNEEFNLKAGVTPLYLAVFENNIEFARLLLANGAMDEGMWGTHLTSKYQPSKPKAVADAAAGTGLEKKGEEMGMKPSTLAEQLGHFGVRDLILSTSGGLEVMQYATMGEVAQLRMALEVGGNINHIDPDHNTALHKACQKGLVDVVKVLLQFGASSSMPNKAGETAKDLANPAIVEIITKQEEENDLYRKIMDTINQGRNKAAKDGSLKQLLTSRPVEDMRKVLDRLDFATRKYRPIHVATFNGSDLVVDLLLQFGANVDAVSYKGDTALMIAATVGSIGCARVLMRAQASVEKENLTTGKTAINIATDLGNNRILNVLNNMDFDVEDEASQANRSEQEQLVEQQRLAIHKEFEKDIKASLKKEMENHFGRMIDMEDEDERKSHLDKIRGLYDTLVGQLKTWAPAAKLRPKTEGKEDKSHETQAGKAEAKETEASMREMVKEERQLLVSMFQEMKQDFEKENLKMHGLMEDISDNTEHIKIRTEAISRMKSHMRYEK